LGLVNKQTAGQSPDNRDPADRKRPARQ
jgi:hypothetical protein